MNYKSDAEWTFSTGWRWLLPVLKGNTIRLHGFTSKEEQLWHETFAMPASLRDTCHIEMLLIDGDRCSKNFWPSAFEIDAARAVCVIAGRPNSGHWRRQLRNHFPCLREYGLLPAANPRVVVPLTRPRTAAALNLHRPGRWVARLGLLAARVLARAGNFALLRDRVLLIATRDSDFLPQGAVQADWAARCATQDMDYALYLGTPDDNRKTVVLPLGPAAPNVILKMAATPKARASLNNEASALAALAETPLAARLPRLLDTVDDGSNLTLYQEYRPRKRAGQRQMDEAVVAFLGNLSRLNAEKKPLAGLLAILPADACKGLPRAVVLACRALHTKLQCQAEAGVTLAVHRSHGDFAPWNCAWTEQGLFVFDWEASRAQDVAFGDAFYYAVAPALLVQRKVKASKTLAATLQLASRVVAASENDATELEVYLAHWLLSRLDQGALYGELCVVLDRSWP